MKKSIIILIGCIWLSSPLTWAGATPDINVCVPLPDSPDSTLSTTGQFQSVVVPLQKLKTPVPNASISANLRRKAVSTAYSSRPLLAIRTNLLYDIGAFTPNLGVELGLTDKSTLLLVGSYNPWNADGAKDNNKKLNHWLANLEYRYWLCERFNGHFFGAHAFFSHYNIGGYKIPFLFSMDGTDPAYRYQGDLYGIGLSYGYQLMLGRRFSVEFNLGIGVGMANYDYYESKVCGQCRGENQKSTFFAPTKAGISLIYIIK